jgi:hypothetical protein
MWIVVSVSFEIVLVLVQDRFTVCAVHTIGSKIVLDAHDGTASDLGHVESRFCLFADSANPDTRLVQGLCRTYHRLGNHFGRIRWISKVRWVMWNLVLVNFETVLVLVQDWFTVCVVHTTGS